MAGKAIDLSLYPKLISILMFTDDLNPHLRSTGWLLKRMDELYDARQDEFIESCSDWCRKGWASRKSGDHVAWLSSP